MGTPKIVLTADRTLMSPYRGLSLATFFGCAPALDPHRDPKKLLVQDSWKTSNSKSLV